MNRAAAGASDTLLRGSRGWVVLAAALVFVLFLIFILPAQQGVVGEDGRSARSPDLSLWYSPSDLYEMAEEYGEDGRVDYVRTRVTFDVVWPAVYVAFLATTISWLSAGGRRALPPRANLVPLAGGALDFLENGCTSAVMLRYPERTLVVDLIAPLATASKWLFVGGAFALLAVGIARLAWRRVARRS